VRRILCSHLSVQLLSENKCVLYSTLLYTSHRNDAFVVTLVACFSVMSGYFTVLIYEYAAAGLEKSSQTAATRLLNLCFQVCDHAEMCEVFSMTI
jgi:hypothetical protein